MLIGEGAAVVVLEALDRAAAEARISWRRLSDLEWTDSKDLTAPTQMEWRGP